MTFEEKVNQIAVDIAVIKRDMANIKDNTNANNKTQSQRCFDNEKTLDDHETRIRSLESDRDKGKGGLIVISSLVGGAVGVSFTLIAKGLGL